MYVTVYSTEGNETFVNIDRDIESEVTFLIETVDKNYNKIDFVSLKMTKKDLARFVNRMNKSYYEFLEEEINNQSR